MLQEGNFTVAQNLCQRQHYKIGVKTSVWQKTFYVILPSHDFFFGTKLKIRSSGTYLARKLLFETNDSR